MRALANAVRDRVRGAIAQSNNTLHPVQVAAVRLAGISVASKRHLLIRGINTAAQKVSFHPAHERLADDDAELPVRDGVREGLRLGGRPGLGVGDGEGDGQDALDCYAFGGRHGHCVREGVAGGEGHGGTAALRADDGRHGDVPVEELGV